MALIDRSICVASWTIPKTQIWHFDRIAAVGGILFYVVCNFIKWPLRAYSVEKLAIIRPLSADSISQVIWEIIRDDGTKTRSSISTIL
jgi:hypothetical protein